MGGNNTHRNDWFSNYPLMEHIVESYKTKGDTIIEDGVWIGIRSMIMPGVRLGEGIVIAAGSVITKDVAPYTIVGGNPAAFIKNPFDEKTISSLLALKIYNLTEEQIEQILPQLCDNNLDELRRRISALG